LQEAHKEQLRFKALAEEHKREAQQSAQTLTAAEKSFEKHQKEISRVSACSPGALKGRN
jgi:ribosomal protein S25